MKIARNSKEHDNWVMEKDPGATLKAFVISPDCHRNQCLAFKLSKKIIFIHNKHLIQMVQLFRLIYLAKEVV